MTLHIGSLTFASPLLLAPMAGYTDLHFRRAVRALGGVGLACSEMINPRSLLHGGGRKRLALLATAADDRPLAYQLYGTEPDLMAEAAQQLQARGACLIDLNMGCPQRKIAGRGAGAGLLKTPTQAIALAARVAAAVSLPVTVKMRRGWDTATAQTAETLAAAFEQAGVAALTLHGRTAQQGYTGAADWPAIRRLVERVRIPVIGNGDVVSPETALALVRETGCAGVMIGRMALKYPWIFREVAAALEGRPPPPPPPLTERYAFLRRHIATFLAEHGPRVGTLLFRRWIPQYARGLHWPRGAMVALLRIGEAERLEEALAALEAAAVTSD